MSADSENSPSVAGPSPRPMRLEPGLGAPSAAAARWRAFVAMVGPVLSLMAVIFFFAAADLWRTNGDSTFLTKRNLRTVAVQTAMVAVPALGMTLIIVAGGIDLSAGTALALCATVLAWFLKHDYPAPLAIACGIGCGACAGAINGALISSLRVVPFIVTLGTMTCYLGLAKIIADETTVRPDLVKQVPVWLQQLTSTHTGALWFGFPTAVWGTLLGAMLLAVVLRYSVFGRYVYALGANEATARLCGIPVLTMKILVYTLAGAFFGLGGVYQFSRLSSGNPTSGTGLELKIIAAVVIGGGSLAGGRGTVVGTLTGAAIMAVISSGCTQLGLKNPLQEIILGVIIVAAVTIDQLRHARTT